MDSLGAEMADGLSKFCDAIEQGAADQLARDLSTIPGRYWGLIYDVTRLRLDGAEVVSRTRSLAIKFAGVAGYIEARNAGVIHENSLQVKDAWESIIEKSFEDGAS